MDSKILQRNAGGFDRWHRAVNKKAEQLLAEDLIETTNQDVPDPYFGISRPKLPEDNATTQDIALWEARERQFIINHTRIQQLLEYMIQIIEPTLYERIITTNNFKRRTPTALYRAVKQCLNPSSKSAEIDLQTRISKLESSSKTTDVDVWLNSWIQVESIAKANNYTWAGEIIDRFHAALEHRSVFFATSFAAHIWLGSISLCQLAEQYRLCESKLKRFNYLNSEDIDNVFRQTSFAAHSQDQEKLTKKIKQNQKNGDKSKFPCGGRYHSIKKCYLFNNDIRPENWVDRRPINLKEKLYEDLQEISKRKEIEKDLGHKVPVELLRKSTDNLSAVVATSNLNKNMDQNDEYLTESFTSDNFYTHSNYMVALASSEVSLPYKNWWVLDSGSGRHICHQKDLFWTFEPIKSQQIIATGAGYCTVQGIGLVVLRVSTPLGVGKLKMENVLYVPEFMTNIVSMDRLMD